MDSANKLTLKEIKYLLNLVSNELYKIQTTQKRNLCYSAWSKLNYLSISNEEDEEDEQQ